VRKVTIFSGAIYPSRDKKKEEKGKPRKGGLNQVGEKGKRLK